MRSKFLVLFAEVNSLENGFSNSYIRLLFHRLKAIEKARNSEKGVKGGEGKTIRGKWLDKYGYPRLVGSGGIFYADQLSTDKEPMGGFNMGKSGSIWPVPKV